MAINTKGIVDELLCEAPESMTIVAEMLDMLKRIAPALDTASHLTKLSGSQEESDLFKDDARQVRAVIAKAEAQGVAQ